MTLVKEIALNGTATQIESHAEDEAASLHPEDNAAYAGVRIGVLSTAIYWLVQERDALQAKVADLEAELANR